MGIKDSDLKKENNGSSESGLSVATLPVRNLGETTQWVEAALSRVGIEEARREAELMCSHLIGQPLRFLTMARAQEINEEQFDQIKSWVERRGHREPLYYIIGECEFWSLPFKVTPAVLIPRPESELLVETGLVFLNEGLKYDPKFLIDESRVVLDLCTGSGCVAVSIASEKAQAKVYATDVSKDALAVAKENAIKNRQEGIEFFRGDLFDAIADLSLQGKFDLIVSNPPYIASGDIAGLQKEIADYEPMAALDGGADGLDIISKIVKDAPIYLKSGGMLALEVGQGQAELVADILRDNGSFIEINIRKDYSGIERIVSARRV
jgi:release factor glutamine methyltransferase